jgi:hypothetical protein
LVGPHVLAESPDLHALPQRLGALSRNPPAVAQLGVVVADTEAKPLEDLTRYAEETRGVSPLRKRERTVALTIGLRECVSDVLISEIADVLEGLPFGETARQANCISSRVADLVVFLAAVSLPLSVEVFDRENVPVKLSPTSSRFVGDFARHKVDDLIVVDQFYDSSDAEVFRPA